MSPGRYLSMFRLHASTCFAMLPVVAAIALANVPGEYTFFDPEHPFGDAKVCDHGWPCTWLVRKGVLRGDEGLWQITSDVCLFDRLALAANLLVAFMILAPLAAALEWRRRRGHRIWQFTLADLLLTALIAGCAMAWYTNQRRQFLRVAKAAQQGDVGWGDEPAFSSWLRKAVGRGQLSKLGVMRPAKLDFDLPGVDPAREADMAAARAVVDGYPEQFRLTVPLYQTASAGKRPPFRGSDYLRSLPKLRHLILERADDEVLGCLARFHDLRTLTIRDDQATLSAAGAAWLASLRQLRQLRVSRQYLGQAGIAALGALTRLEVVALDGAADADLAPLARLYRVRVLELPHATVTDAGLASLAEARRLEQLSIHSTRITGAGFQTLNGLSRLHTLDLSYSGVTDDGLAGLSGLHSLVFLDLEFTPVTGAGLPHIADLRHLRRLRLNLTELDDGGLGALPELPRLEFLDLSNTRITQASLRSLNSLPALCELSLANSRVASLEPLDFARLRFLKKLDVRDAWVSEAGAEAVESAHPTVAVACYATVIPRGRLKNEQELDLSRSGVGDEFLLKLENCNGLREIRLKSCRVTDAGLARLAEFQDLEKIDLAGTPVGDAGLAFLCRLPRPRSLDIAYTSVTREGLLQLATFPVLEHVALDPSQIDASVVSLLQRMPKLGRLSISRERAPWGAQYRGAADFKELIRHLRRDLPALSFSTWNTVRNGIACTMELQ